MWENEGPMPIINSIAVVIDWLTASGNYKQWLGGNKQNGTTKLGITNEICQIIQDKGITTERTGRDIYMKINHLDQQFNKFKIYDYIPSIS